MTEIALKGTVLGAMLVLLLHTPVHALTARTWVASIPAGGNDAHACSRTAPCKTFAVAVARTIAGGEINCIDAADYGRVTITKSLSIVCDNTEVGIFAAGTFGITVNTLATDTVTLKGIDIEGFGTGTNGINFIRGAARPQGSDQKFSLHHGGGSRTRDQLRADARGGTIRFGVLPHRQGAGFAGSGISIAAAAAATVAITNTRVENNLNGIRIINVSSDTLKVAVTDSTIVGNTNAGIGTSSTSGPNQLMLKNIVVANNGAHGVFNSGPVASTRIGNSVVTGNAIGVENAGGSFTSYKNNQIRLNTLDGTPLATEMFE